MELGDLPPELMTEILRRLSLKDTMKSKCICKRWDALISDPTFLQYRRRLRCQSPSNKQQSNPIRLLICSSDDRNGNNQLYLSTSNNINDSSGTLKLALDDHKRGEVWDDMVVLSSSFLELVLLYMPSPEPVHLYNPSTGELFALPKNPDWENCLLSSMGLGRVDSTKEYKVVRVFESFRKRKCEVFTLGSDDHWRTVAAPPFAISDDPAAFVAGGVYMLPLWLEHEKCIARFDIELEEWTMIAPPKCFFLSSGSTQAHLSIREVGGLFCLTDNSSGVSADVWVLKDYEQGIWALLSRIQFSYFFDEEDLEEECPYLYPLSLDYGDGKVLLVSVDDDYNRTEMQLFSYDPKTRNVEELPIPHPSTDFTATLFTESVESLF